MLEACEMLCVSVCILFRLLIEVDNGVTHFGWLTGQYVTTPLVLCLAATVVTVPCPACSSAVKYILHQ